MSIMSANKRSRDILAAGWLRKRRVGVGEEVGYCHPRLAKNQAEPVEPNIIATTEEKERKKRKAKMPLTDWHREIARIHKSAQTQKRLRLF